MEHPEIFGFDHVYPGSEEGDFIAVLYGALGTPCFARLHALLAGASQEVCKIIVDQRERKTKHMKFF